METQKKKAYIGGKVTGLPMDQVIEKFKRKAVELYHAGYEVTNPVARILSLNFHLKRIGEPPMDDENNRKEIMGLCLYDLSKCDELHLLHDWTDSPGAHQERDFAQRNGIEIIYH